MTERSDPPTRTTKRPGVESDGIGPVRRSFMRRGAVSAAERMARKVTIPHSGERREILSLHLASFVANGHSPVGLRPADIRL
jgi:hypothetical protein